MKRKVTFVVGKLTEHPTDSKDCAYRQAEIEVPDDWSSLRPIALSVATSGPGNRDDTYDNVAVIIEHHKVANLVGKLLTYVDATFTDVEQRKAHKDIVNQIVYDWYSYHMRNAEKTIKFAKTFDNPILK